MRKNITRRGSTKGERRFYEILKEARIPFRHRWIVHGHEVDFLIGNYAVEVNGNHQDADRTKKLMDLGITVIHIDNSFLRPENKTNLLQWVNQIQSIQTV